MNLRMDPRFYSVREYAFAIGAALVAGLVIAVMLNAVGGGPPSGETSLRLAEKTERAPSTNLAAIQNANDEREALVTARRARARLAAVREARRTRRAGRARRATIPAPAPETLAVPAQDSLAESAVPESPVVAPTPAPAPRPAPAPVRSPSPKPSSQGKSGGGFTFDDSG